MYDTTLQINLSPGDIAYAALTVPALVAAHRDNVDEKVAIVDCCKPGRTKIVDPDTRFPEPEFSEKVVRIKSIAEDLKAQGCFDRIEYLYPDIPLFKEISKKYLRGIVSHTHDYGACALMSYLAAFELINTRFLLHYDSDMLLYQEQDYDWSVEAKTHMAKDENIIAAIARPSPVFSAEEATDAPSLNSWPPYTEVPGGWRDNWYSTRYFLFDREKLFESLPLLQGRALLDTLLVKYLNRGYPRSPEVMLAKRLKNSEKWRLNLSSEKAWALHPVRKPKTYIELLPKILEAIKAAKVPDEQKGHPDIVLSAWEVFLNEQGEN